MVNVFPLSGRARPGNDLSMCQQTSQMVDLILIAAFAVVAGSVSQSQASWPRRLQIGVASLVFPAVVLVRRPSFSAERPALSSTLAAPNWTHYLN